MIGFLKRMSAPLRRADAKTAKHLLTSPETRRAMVLFASQILGILFAFLTQKLNTNYLSKEEFGAVTWCTQLFIMLHPLFEFGYFLSGTRALTRAHEKEKVRQWYGVLILVMGVMGLLMSVSLLAVTVLFPSLFNDELTRNAMLVASSLAWAYVLQFFLQSVVQGAGDVNHLSMFTVMSRFLTMASLGLWIYLGRLSVEASLLLSMGAMACSGVFVLWRLSPRFTQWRDLLPELRSENKEYGWHIYIGKLVSVPTFQLAPIMIPYFSTLTSSAIYGVGSNLVTPMVQATQSISMTMFKNFSQQKKLKDRLILINVMVLMIIGGSIYVFAPFLITLSANETYQQAVPYMLPLVLGGFFQGLWQPFHQFALARGKGEWMKHQLIMGSVTDLALALVLVPLYGLEGACWQFCLGRVIRFFLTLHNYYRTVKHIESVS